MLNSYLLELNRVAEKVYRQQGSRLLFDDSLLERIYSEGVYPSQGTRPVFSTINHLVTGNLGRIFIEIARAGVNPTEIVMKAGPCSFELECRGTEGKGHSFSLPQEWNLEKMRAVKCDNHQALTAVHESGHAILAIFLMHMVPESIFSTSAMGDSSGMVRVDGQERINSPANLLARLATDLGGLAAEEMIFGEENRSTGSESDIEKATGFALHLLKSCGFGKVPAAVHVADRETRNFIHHPSEFLDQTAENWLCNAHRLALDTLASRKGLLLRMAGYLSENRSLNRSQIERMVFAGGIDRQPQLPPASFPYRATLAAAISREPLEPHFDPGGEALSADATVSGKSFTLQIKPEI